MVILFKDLTSKGQVSCYNNKVPKRVQSFSAGSLHSAKKIKKNSMVSMEAAYSV